MEETRIICAAFGELEEVFDGKRSGSGKEAERDVAVGCVESCVRA